RKKKRGKSEKVKNSYLFLFKSKFPNKNGGKKGKDKNTEKTLSKIMEPNVKEEKGKGKREENTIIRASQHGRERTKKRREEYVGKCRKEERTIEEIN
ncbi:hypothetical protein IscW_ISCW002813, partial [Ixodes scapularis]